MSESRVKIVTIHNELYDNNIVNLLKNEFTVAEEVTVTLEYIDEDVIVYDYEQTVNGLLFSWCDELECYMSEEHHAIGTYGTTWYSFMQIKN